MFNITNHHGNINQNPSEISPQYLGWPLFKYKTNIARKKWNQLVEKYDLFINNNLIF